MPKKGKGKKKGGKGKGKGEKKGAEPPPPVKAEEEKLTELSKQFYLIQIKDLEERLARYQAKCDQLQLANDEFQKQLKQQKEDQEQVWLCELIQCDTHTHTYTRLYNFGCIGPPRNVDDGVFLRTVDDHLPEEEGAGPGRAVHGS